MQLPVSSTQFLFVEPLYDIVDAGYTYVLLGDEIQFESYAHIVVLNSYTSWYLLGPNIVHPNNFRTVS